MSDDTLAMLADAAADFAKPDARRIRALRARGTDVDRDTWRAMADLGWYSILIPEAQGGLGLNLAAATTVAQRLGYAAFPEPFVASGLMVPALLAQAGDRAAAHRESVSTGACLAALAWQEAAGGLDPQRPAVRARGDESGITLEGEARFVVPADGLALYWVPRSQAGLAVRVEACADGTGSGWLTLTGARVPAEACLLRGDAALEALRLALDAGVLGTSAELVGLMDRALEMTLDYLRTRQQFGKPIGSFQALQHRAVDIWIQLKLAGAVLDASVRRFDSPGADAQARASAASSAKSRAAHAALVLCNQAVQLHGAIGYTDDYDLGLYLNRVLTISGWLGNATEHRRRYSALSLTQGAGA
jgi:alkylation response protein AidB-like acyl-CoA dehydrogenase